MQVYYYPKTLSSITTALLNVFSNMVIYKYTSAGTSADSKSVPITFGPVDKSYSKRTEGPQYYDSDNVEHGQRYYLTLPRMALILDGMSYDNSRCYGSNEYRTFLSEATGINNIDEVFQDYQPTPINYSYTLSIKSDSMDYYCQIIENVLPYFNPALFIRVKEFSFLNIERDLPVKITNIGLDFSEDLNAEDKRYTNGTIGLNVEGWMYRPWSKAKIIKFINSSYYIGDSITNMTSAVSLSSDNYVSATSMIIDRYYTSGVEVTSAGIYNPTSAVPASGSYYTSGHYRQDGIYDVNDKNFDWWRSFSATSG